MSVRFPVNAMKLEKPDESFRLEPIWLTYVHVFDAQNGPGP